MFKQEIHELKESLTNAIDRFIDEAERRDYSHQISRKIAAQKEPYLRELLTAAQTNSPLNKNYTASDILTVLEELDDFVNGHKMNEKE